MHMIKKINKIEKDALRSASPTTISIHSILPSLAASYPSNVPVCTCKQMWMLFASLFTQNVTVYSKYNKMYHLCIHAHTYIHTYITLYLTFFYLKVCPGDCHVKIWTATSYNLMFLMGVECSVLAVYDKPLN